jgi:hypothetical protein
MFDAKRRNLVPELAIYIPVTSAKKSNAMRHRWRQDACLAPPHSDEPNS